MLESYCVCLIQSSFLSLLKHRPESSFLNSVLLKIKYILGIRPVCSFLFTQAWKCLCLATQYCWVQHADVNAALLLLTAGSIGS